jgi:CubicO group peptidase (beta-lactamase class C family)
MVENHEATAKTDNRTNVTRTAVTENARDGAGYGYLWWINGFGLPVRNFYALGAVGKFLTVIPERDFVVLLPNHTEFPPNGSTMPLASTTSFLPCLRRTLGTCLACSLRRSPQRTLNAGIEEERRTSSPRHQQQIGIDAIFFLRVELVPAVDWMHRGT